MIEQPRNLRINLFPHQLASVYKMEHLEATRTVMGQGRKFITDLGINADITGYGKTIAMVALILRDKMPWNLDTPYEDETVQTCSNHVRIHSFSRFPKQNTTLVLAGTSIIHQWQKEFSQTDLRVTKITTHSQAQQVDPNNYDVIIVSPTAYNLLVGRFANTAWKRFIYDEPGNTRVPAMKNIIAGFIWLVTATPVTISERRNSCRGFLRELSYGIRNVLDAIIIENKPEFIRRSFEMPPTQHVYYKCFMPVFRALDGLVDQEIANLIEGGNFAEAIQALGGSRTDNIMETVKKNKNLELEIIRMEAKIEILRGNKENIKKCQDREEKIIRELGELEKRFSQIMDQNCSICFDKLVKPVMEPSCQNIFCGGCLFEWLHQNKSCPLCRREVDTKNLVYIDKQDAKQEEEKKESVPRLKTKEEIIIELITENKEGKFIIFSDWFASFEGIRSVLKTHNIPFVEVKGSAETRAKKLEKFKQGEIGVLFLNSLTDSSGINIQETTDIILYHDMLPSNITQILGRANRIGRKIPLKVHHLIKDD